jgi:hypothetical protein
MVNAMLMSRIEDLGRAVAAEPQRDVTRRRLYAPIVHWIARIAYSTMGVFFAAAVVGIAKSFAEERLYWGAAPGIPVLIFCTLLLVTTLRTSALYGSPEGIEIARWGKRRVIPWWKVGTAEYAWWSTNRVSRIAKLTIHEQEEKTVIFFANDRVLADLEAMRALYTRS